VVSQESGSSVATAAASGLTGLFLWLSKLIKDNSYLKDKRNIHTVFEHLANTQFLDVRRFFETHFKRLLAELEKAEKGNDSKQTISQIMSSYDISTMEWTANCQKALERMMTEVFDYGKHSL
jgi:hypothetical protein